ncbi:tyrosine-type recombinase/integrase [Chloroflexota bacterium]
MNSLKCTNGGKHAYYRVLRVFYRWFYSARSGYELNPQDNPMLNVDPPKVERRLLPSVTSEQVDSLLETADNIRDKCIVSLFADSGLRLHEMTHIRPEDIDWTDNIITIIGKGNKQRRAPFTYRTAKLLKSYLNNHHVGYNEIWGLSDVGIEKMLKRLNRETGIECNPHAFRRGFACNLHRKGLSTLDIMHLGGWSDLSMVLRYTQSITFEDCLKHYRAAEL